MKTAILRAVCLLALAATALAPAPRPAWAAVAAAADVVDPAACVRLFDAHGYEEAQGCFSAYLARRPDDSMVLSYLGRTCFERRQAQEAIKWLERAVAREPGRSEFHDWLGRAYGIAAERAVVVRQLDLAVRARKQFERSVELDPANLDALEDLIQFEVQAPPLLGGSLDKAQRHAAEIERRDPLRGRLARAEVLLRRPGSGPQAALAELRGAAADFPGDPRPRLALAAAYTRAGRYAAAFDELEAVLRLDPGNADAHHQLARTAALSGRRLDRAEELLSRDLKRWPPGDGAALADGHFELASVLERKGDLAGARGHFQEALRLDPGSAAARAALRRLR
jgi:tetratricopeptide (TPR) repeat protein